MRTDPAHAQTIQVWADAISAADIDRYLACFADEVLFEDLGLQATLRDKAHLHDLAAAWFESFTDERLRILAHLEGDGISAVQWELDATVRSNRPGITEHARVGAKCTIYGMTAFRFDEHARFSWERSHWDKTSVLRQITAPEQPPS